MDQLSCNFHVDDDDDHGWTKVVSRKQKPAKMVSADVEDESNSAGAARNENLKEEKTKKPKPKKKKKKKPIVSLSEAMSKIDHSRLQAFLVVSLVNHLNSF
ncbi:hypothetical protein ISN45_Aa04g013340 [Arabidopsis thaliana x Arabidopsis arenosa]|uniref:Uncharacterized protein n=1 Tax=Arabidopsis thaliana x Arabidopsis arenosa TaxID=1240361 RepID=A0A8T2A983_9BRAS|nr:hypothetical protein ISN45_Aa04g013340 [Arabidopsis thaliana x Arabidopsis arenosa]